MQSAVMVQPATLADCEQVIENYVTSYSLAGQALLDIYQRQLWKEGERYDTFEAYVVDRWQFSASRASQLMSAGKFWRHMVLSRIALPPPETERHFRPLLKVRGATDEETLDRRAECWEAVHFEATKNNVTKISPDFVDEVVQRLTGGVKKKAPEPSPLRLSELELAFEHIADCGMTPEQARIEFGDPATWQGFNEALSWMERVKAL